MVRVAVNLFAVAVVACAICFGAGQAHATPLAMSYEITDIGGGLYDYEFKLVLDNNDGSWSAGHRWNWIVFGDKLSSSSPLSDFAGDTGDLPIGPFIAYTYCFGGHNGPTLLDNSQQDYYMAGWQPAGIGDFLAWSGTSAAYVGQGDMFFSTLNYSYTLGAVPADMELANLRNGTSPVPEPATMALFGLGAAAGALARRKRAA